MKNKMKQWRREARKHNEERSEQLGKKIRHQGRKNKSTIGESWRGAMYPLLETLFARVGLINRNAARV
jgi:hypothetical protein